MSNELVWPNGVRMSLIDWRPISNSESTPAPLSGGMQTVARPGDRIGVTIYVENSSGAERALLRAFASRMRGRSGRIMLPDYSYRRRGSFPVTELFANADFSNAIASWSSDPPYTLTASDNSLRCTVNRNAAATAYHALQSIALTQYAPYVSRFVANAGSGSFPATYCVVEGQALQLIANGNGYGVGCGVTTVSSAQVHGLWDGSTTSGKIAGDSLMIRFASLSRCAMADSPANLLLQSDALGVTWSPSNATINSNVVLCPDGTTSADALTESGVTNVDHYVSQSVSGLPSAVTDFSCSFSIQAGARSWASIRMIETTGSTAAYAFFNVSTGALGITAVGANWSNVRSQITPQGNGWFRCAITARKTNAATVVSILVGSATADGSFTYAGTGGSNAIYLWRASLAQSALPARGRQTTSSQFAADTQQGPSIYVKGLPASTLGLLKTGDQVEADKQLKFLVADLDSDGAGMGYLQLDSPFSRALADNTPIIVEKPMAKFVLMNDPEYPSRAGDFSDFRFDFEQDLAP